MTGSARSIHEVYLLHGKGGRPTGSVFQLEELLLPALPGVRFTRPALRHGDPEVLAEDSLAALAELPIPEGAAVVGVSLGGLVAARLQETTRPDLTVVTISSPTWADGVTVAQRMPRRLALYSSCDEVIAGRTAAWPQLGLACDLPWLTHATDEHKGPLTQIVAAYLKGLDPFAVVLAVEAELRGAGKSW